MDNIQLEEKVIELADAIKKIADISNDDYFGNYIPVYTNHNM